MTDIQSFEGLQMQSILAIKSKLTQDYLAKLTTALDKLSKGRRPMNQPRFTSSFATSGNVRRFPYFVTEIPIRQGEDHLIIFIQSAINQFKHSLLHLYHLLLPSMSGNVLNFPTIGTTHHEPVLPV